MDDAMEFLESRPLVGFQMDGSHLHNVLRRVIQEQQQQAQFQRQMTVRLADLEDDVRNMNMRQKEFEKALGNLGPDAFRKMRQQIEYLDEGLETIARDVKDTRQLANEAARAAEDAGHEVQSVGRGLAAVQDRQDRLQQLLDDMAAEMDQQNGQLGEAIKAIEREQAEQMQQTQSLFRDLEHMNGQENWQKLRDMVDELSERTDKNFRSVEESARAVDAELTRHRSDLNGLQANIGSLDDMVRQYLSNIARDVDAKCQMILGTLREHERSSLEIEEHMVAAGQALARRKGLKEARGNDSIGTRRNGCATSSDSNMYVGAWQEYKLMKVIENLREENERLRRDASGSAGGSAPATSRHSLNAGHGSSHHFPVGLKDVPAGGETLADCVLPTHREYTVATPTPLRQRGCQNPKATTLRLMTTVRDVDVFVEEEANAGAAPLSSSVSFGSRSCSEGMDNKKSLSLSGKKSCEHENQVRTCLMNNVASSETTSSAPVHAELGTGRILRAPQQRATHPTAMDGGASLLPPLLESSRVREDPFLRELLRGAPLDTKTRYQQAGQPLPERQAQKKPKRGPSLSEEEVQKRVERRLRLQMLYSGKVHGNEHVSPAMRDFMGDYYGSQVTTPSTPPIPSGEQSQPATVAVPGIGQSFPGVPWDFSAPRLPNVSAAGATALVKTSKDTSSAATEDELCTLQYASPLPPSNSRLKHPYDVGAPLAPPTFPDSPPEGDARPPFSLTGTRKVAEGGENYGNGFIGNKTFMNCPGDGPRPVTMGGHDGHTELKMQGGLLAEAFCQVEGRVSAGNPATPPALRVDGRPVSAAGPMDDDSIGMLINWAEQLDPDSIG